MRAILPIYFVMLRLRRLLLRALSLATLVVWPTFAFGGVEQLPEPEFRELAAELSHKVNLFRDAWDNDPAAQFYGGTTRDYLYWLKGKFRAAKTADEARKIADELRAGPLIDVREFIIGDSDVDVFSEKSFTIRPENYGVKKVDTQKMDVLDPTTELGKNEIDQGFLPAEKIRLGKGGLAETPGLGHGVSEIYSGHLTAHFTPPEQFARSKYAAEGINHPILLALRYLRLQAINYFQEHGGGAIDEKALLAQIDPATAKEVHRLVEEALDGKTLAPFLEKPQFKKWINAGIQKAFRSYTNPNAAKALMEEFRVTKLPTLYPEEIEPVNQYVFARQRDPAAAKKALGDFGVDEAKFFRPVKEEFPDGFLYHGTRDEKAFRSIVFQGVLGSTKGLAGEGLYGVSAANKEFSERWAGDKNRLLRFPVKADARIVDITHGEGKRIWEEFSKREGAGRYQEFADRFDVDLLAYPYDPPAYVVKNSEALGKAEGVYRKILTVPEVLKRARGMTDLEEFANLLAVNNLSEGEQRMAALETKISPAAIEEALREKRHTDLILTTFFREPRFHGREDLVRFLIDALMPPSPPRKNDDFDRLHPLAALFAEEPWSKRRDLLLEYIRRVPDEEEQLARPFRVLFEEGVTEAAAIAHEFVNARDLATRKRGLAMMKAGLLNADGERDLLRLTRDRKLSTAAWEVLYNVKERKSYVLQPETLRELIGMLRSPSVDRRYWATHTLAFYDTSKKDNQLAPFVKEIAEAIHAEPLTFTKRKWRNFGSIQANLVRALSRIDTPEAIAARIGLLERPPSDPLVLVDLLNHSQTFAEVKAAVRARNLDNNELRLAVGKMIEAAHIDPSVILAAREEIEKEAVKPLLAPPNFRDRCAETFRSLFRKY